MLAIVGFGNLNVMQYLYKYTLVLDDQNVDYDVIYWNRSGASEQIDFKGNPIPFNHTMNTYQPFHKKVLGFLKYSLFLRRQIKRGRYDKIIVLTTQTAIPLFDILTRKYKGRFIYDYRDITKEKKLSVYRNMVKKLIHCSAYTMISSKGFLPEIGVEEKENIITAHNTRESLEGGCYSVKISETEPIRLVFWGMVRQVEHNKRLCDALGVDPRFTITYHGEGFYRDLENYCKEKGYGNVTFTGRYDLQELPRFIENTDILHCFYENDATQKHAMPVKPYDAIRYRLPMVVSKGSYLAKYFGECSGVCTLDPEDMTGLAEQIYDWYKALNKESAEKDYAYLQEKIYNDDYNFRKLTISFVEKQKG